MGFAPRIPHDYDAAREKFRAQRADAAHTQISSAARSLADHLSEQPEANLRQLFSRRGVGPSVEWRDFFDAAEALLEDASIERALRRLTLRDARDAVEFAAGHVPPPQALTDLALVVPGQEASAAVLTAIRALGAVPSASASPPVIASESDSARAAEQAFTTVAAIADLVVDIQRRSLSLLSHGAIAAVDRRRLSEGWIAEAVVDDLLALAEAAHVTEVNGRTLRAGSEATAWLGARSAQRWFSLVTSFRESLPEALRPFASSTGAWVEQYPWNPEWPRVAADFARQAVLLGLYTPAGAPTPWAGALPGERAANEISRYLPAEVDRVFLQDDLTAIAPGPLAGRLDVRLRQMADREAGAQASQYRFSNATLTRALSAGEDEQSILAFLQELSLTPVPQPLRYLIEQTSRRHGVVTVSSAEARGSNANRSDAQTRTIVTSTDASLLDTITVDQGLGYLGFFREGDRLTTRADAATVHSALTAARYPATREESPDRIHTVTSSPPRRPPSESYDVLIGALRARSGENAESAWIERELASAIRERSTVAIVVALPDGSTREFVLEATGLGGGRIRGRDRAADVERTLPLSHIREVRSLTD